MPSSPQHVTAPSSPVLERHSLRSDCSSCFALCCTALGFSRSTDFALDKPAGAPCQNLASDFSCTIHDRLRPRGFRGCTVFDCFGAGQHVSQKLFGGTSWRTNPKTKQDMFAAFTTARQLHEMLWHLIEATRRTYDPDLKEQATELRTTIENALGGDAHDVLDLAVEPLHEQVRGVLMDVSEEVRVAYFANGGDHLEDALTPGADLIGQNFRAQSLCGADLRGAYLIAADLRNCDLSGADLLGTDLRDALLHDADLSTALYLTQPQLNAAQGNHSTGLPADLVMPTHWHED
ncbi:pentapeptide repeat-containing protein [Kocuria sabuli]|uniref:pentapeptide repeat-containing protein n=1 Tax=Kocuria sabuli TaxID=3071448 RepID=UPI0034D5F3F1